MNKNTSYICLIIAAVCVSVFTSGCYYDKEELLYPDSSCDTSAVKYSTSVVPILAASCYSCHAGNTPSGSVRLDTYNDVKAHAASGRLVGAISHSPGFSPMPKNGTKMNNCNISVIKKWITDGTPNN